MCPERWLNSQNYYKTRGMCDHAEKKNIYEEESGSKSIYLTVENVPTLPFAFVLRNFVLSDTCNYMNEQ